MESRSNDTVAAGLLHFALRRSQNVQWQTLDVTKDARAAQKGQRACVLWLTGLSGAGKTTIANLVEKRHFAVPGRAAHRALSFLAEAISTHPMSHPRRPRSGLTRPHSLQRSRPI